ncbi:beta-propeller fold lactonase family protein [Myxococcota bacterium]
MVRRRPSHFLWTVFTVVAVVAVVAGPVTSAGGPRSDPEFGAAILTKDGVPTLALRKMVPVGYWPKSVELTPKGDIAVVASIKGRSATLVDTETLDVVRTLTPPEFAPVETTFLPHQKRALISAGFLAHEVKIFDLDTWKQVGRLRGGRRGRTHTIFPKVMAVSPDATKIYVTYWVSENVGVFDTTTLKRLGVVEVGAHPRGIAITGDGKKGYVCNFGLTRKSITVFDADEAPFDVIGTIRGLPNPRHIVMSNDGRHAFVSLYGEGGGVAKIDSETDEVIARSASTGEASKTLKLSADEKWIYLVNYGSGTVSILESASLEEVARYHAGVYPQGLSISADGKTLWTTEQDRVRIWDVSLPESPLVKRSKL